jgi:epoxyqueuosine reductase
MTTRQQTHHVRSIAEAMGFDRVGFAAADVALDADRFKRWLAEKHHAGMGFLAENVELRHHPGELIENARSIICLVLNYAPAEEIEADAFVARYARGRDYHKVLKQRCHRLMDAIREAYPEFEGRAFVDSGPLRERQLAPLSGVGFRGRNGCIIADDLGSFVVLAEIVCNLPLTPDVPCMMNCMGCGQCIGVCPTRALQADGTVDARLCRSYLTIEHKGQIPRERWPQMGDCVFGCDECLRVCPHNQTIPAGDAELATPREAVRALSLRTILTWTEAHWDAATRGSAMRRARYPQFLRNAVLAAGNSGNRELTALLESLKPAQPELAEEIEWAIDQISAGR